VNEPGTEVGRVLALVEAQPAAADAALGTAGWLQRLCNVAVSDLPAWGVAVSLMTEERSSGMAAASDATCGSVEELQFLLGEGPFLDAFTLRRPVLVPDLAGDAAAWWPTFAGAAHEYGVRAVFAFPLQVGAARLGVLDVYRDEVGSLSIVELARALTFAQVATTALLDGQERARAGHPPRGIDHALESRYELHQAQGMVMVQLGINLADAMARLRAYAYSHERSLGLVAADVVARRLTLEQG
jgi:GAF domain-containing protein